ncbi:GFA family protein [Neiella sp. HB171785]|uniref:GFA family protein n=1 Tax=Neiella litorisoli TaxID=2771431 RepID=A0A8J6QIM1_9GAMM|nr:GFA family protein [Neiella litorisoli]MBD1388706.1 GFA family protein [Neiella litorisoli]
MKGECNCGTVSFEITAETNDVYICHCSICRKATGSGGIAVIVVANDDFHWLSGQTAIKTWHKPEHDWQTSFCCHCGSSLPGANDSKRMYVPVGLLSEGADDLNVAHHIWVDSKASWEQIADSGQQHPQAFNG